MSYEAPFGALFSSSSNFFPSRHDAVLEWAANRAFSLGNIDFMQRVHSRTAARSFLIEAGKLESGL